MRKCFSGLLIEDIHSVPNPGCCAFKKFGLKLLEMLYVSRKKWLVSVDKVVEVFAFDSGLFPSGLVSLLQKA